MSKHQTIPKRCRRCNNTKLERVCKYCFDYNNILGVVIRTPEERIIRKIFNDTTRHFKKSS